MAKTVKEGTDFKESFGKLEDTLKVYLVDKAPFQLPESAKEAIVKYGPWITLVLLVLSLPVLLAALGLGAVMAPFAFLGGVQAGVSYGIGLIFTVLTLILEAMALPGLFKRSKGGWRLFYYSTLVSGIGNLISFNLGGLIIGTGLSLYILFQIRSYYK